MAKQSEKNKRAKTVKEEPIEEQQEQKTQKEPDINFTELITNGLGQLGDFASKSLSREKEFEIEKLKIKTQNPQVSKKIKSGSITINTKKIVINF